MKKTIYKSFIYDFVKFFTLTLFSLSLIVWIIQAVNYLDFVSEDGHSFKIYFLYTFFNIPKIVSKLMMFVFFLSLFYSIVKLEDKNELIIFWINGIKKIEVKRVIIFLSLFFLALQLLLNAYVTPKSQDMARSFIRGSNIDFLPSLIKEKKFIDIVEGLTIFIEEKDTNQKFRNVFLKENIKNTYQIIFAKYGEIKLENNNIFMVLKGGKLIDKNKKDQRIISFKETIFNLSKYQTKSITMQKIQETDTLFLHKCTSLIRKNNFELLKKFNEKIGDFNNRIHCKKKMSKRMYEELLKRLVYPFYIPLLSMIAALIILKSKEDKSNNSYRMFLFFVGFVVIVTGEILLRYAGPDLKSNIKFFILPILLFFSFNYFFNIKSTRS